MFLNIKIYFFTPIYLLCSEVIYGHFRYCFFEKKKLQQGSTKTRNEFHKELYKVRNEKKTVLF